MAIEFDLFTWWMICISFSILFIIIVAIYIYRANRLKRTTLSGEPSSEQLPTAVKFVFIWVLASLLVFYIISVYLGSILFFAIGNIVVEILLIGYLFKNKTKKDE